MNNLLQEYKNIVNEIKEYIRTELEKRYDDIVFEDYNDIDLLDCVINDDVLCIINLENKLIYVKCYNMLKYDDVDTDIVETFEELYKYIDDVISEGV